MDMVVQLIDVNWCFFILIYWWTLLDVISYVTSNLNVENMWNSIELCYNIFIKEEIFIFIYT